MKFICIWCKREITGFNESVNIPYVSRGELTICFPCIRLLNKIREDMEIRHGLWEDGRVMHG